MKFGIIGLGNIGRVHAQNLLEGRIENGELSAVAGQPPSTMDEYREKGIPCFDSTAELLASGLTEAVIVALPTALHVQVGTEVLDAGLHLMMEKPLARHKAEGEQLLSACRHPGQRAALMMNQRAHPCYLRIKKWIDEGAIGPLQRVSWTMTNWFRPEIYYQSSDWRATWQGEGGGVLMNQCPHNIDVLQWLVGMPRSVRAHCAFGKYHDIEVEDEVSAYLEFPNGATGQFTASTGEAPGTNRLEIVGDRGSVMTDGNEARLIRNSEPVSRFSRTTEEMFGCPETTEELYRPEEAINQHAVVLNNFIQAVNGDAELIAPAGEGVHSLELAGAMIYSSWINDAVELPLDGEVYGAALQERIAQSKPREVTRAGAQVDMSKSYR